MPHLRLPDGRLAYRDRGAGRALTALHGFTLGGASWLEVARLVGPGRRWLLPDLRGHGGTRLRAGAPHTLAAAADDVVRLWDALDLPAADLLGYSMGGRLALHLAAARPERIARLVVVSAHAGLAPAARPARRAADAALAAALERDGLPAFLDAWTAQPLFAGLARRGAGPQRRFRRWRLRSHPAGLTASLREMGAGTMDPVWDGLARVRAPVLLVVGAEDARYRAAAERLRQRMPQAELAVVPGAGHAVPLERPHRFARVLREFLDATDS